MSQRIRKTMSDLRFELFEKKPKTDVYTVISNHGGVQLGRIGWYPQWRQYVFIPFPDTLYSDGCMGEIASKIKQLMDERKEK
jgi:hypothetical protein